MRYKKKLLDFFIQFNTAVTGNHLLTAIRNGFTYMVPFALLGSFALVFLSLPIEAYRNFMTHVFGDSWSNMLMFVRDGTFNFFSLIAVICISYSYAQEMNEHKGYVSPVISSITSLAAFVALSGINKESFSMSHFGVIGIFIAIMVTVISSILFRRLAAIRFFKIHLYSDGANPNFNSAISLFVPAALTISLFAVLNQVFFYYFEISDIQTFLAGCLLKFFSLIRSDFLGGILFIVLIHLFWVLGIHGSNMMEPVAQGIFVPALELNQQLIRFGLEPSQIFTKTFFDTFVLMGGCGSMLCLVLAMLLTGQNKSQKSLAQLSAIPVLFNINELMVFGVPIVLNPVYVLPFLLVPLMMTAVSYVAVQLGLVPYTTHAVEWTTPIFLSGYVSTGSVSGSLLQMFNLTVGTLIYVPFIRLSEKVNQSRKIENLNQIYKAFTHFEERGNSAALLSRHDKVGSVARLLAADLEYDLNHEKVRLFYQPIIDNNEKVAGLEALLRWEHSSYGFIYPPLIISLAEESHLMDTLGTWIMDRACADLAAIHQCGFSGLSMCINISNKQFEDEKLPELLNKAIQKHRINPSDIEIEVTEKLALLADTKISAMIDKIDQMGVRLAMDDFGMGHSSMMYLKECNFHIVKLDGSLVKDVLRNSNCCTLISSIVALGRTMNYKVVAEYVEEGAQRDILFDLGCDYYQGYLYSKAVPFNDVLEFIKSKNSAMQTK